MIRAADKIKDFDMLMGGLHKYAAKCPSEFFSKDEEVLRKSFRALLDVPNVQFIISENEGVLEGVFGFIVSKHIWDIRKNVLIELAWWCDEDAPPRVALEIFNKVINGAKESGCDMLVIHSMSNSPAGVDKLYLRRGLKLIQKVYYKEF
jgi:hypothetical protein